MPRQIDSRHIAQRKTTKKRHSGIAAIVETDWLFEIEPPLPLDRRQAAWNSGRSVNPLHPEQFRQFFCDVVTAGAQRAFVSFLQSKYMDAREQFVIREGACRAGDQFADVFRASGHTHQTHLAP